MTWQTETWIPVAARLFLRTRDAEGLDQLSAAAGLNGIPLDEYEAMLREELAKLDHATHEWWEVPCNCQGHLN